MNLISLFAFIIGIIGISFAIRNHKIIKEKEKTGEFIKNGEEQLQKLQEEIKENDARSRIAIANRKEYEETCQRLEKALNTAKEHYSDYMNLLEYRYVLQEQDFDQNLTDLKAGLKKSIESYQKEAEERKLKISQEIDAANEELQILKNHIDAGLQAGLENIDEMKYKLQISQADLEDAKALLNLRGVLGRKDALSKLVWSEFVQKEATSLCNRVLGSNVVCGIYKITNITTQQSYVGQSVNIAERWKQHIKCGLGINASSTNKLYNAMQQDTVWNFTFQLLEECPKDKLNETEKFWIEMCQSNTLGYNSTKGGS